MSKNLLLLLFCLIGSANFACSSETAPSANSANSASVMTNLDPKNMPPGLSGNAVPPSGNATPGIPAPQNVNAVSKGATPTPGIPANPGKPLPKGATPTPGIPDPATANKQMNSGSTTGTASNQAAGDLRPRTVQKP